ncbi:MAG: Holliday junction branch migration protein RuvA [Oscillospiraceae bacterium]|nr:Holliday junction branch migration protein RuvA [Oscillospiraceae bacterium]
MFYHISGKVAAIETNLAVIDCWGIGFSLNATVNTLSHLQIGEAAKLYTYENVREDAFDLYGFYDRQEKRCFEMLIDVSGVGPKAALSVLSSVTPEALAMAVISGDEKALTAAPGIGKKIAQRILLELKDKIAKETDGMAKGGAAAAAPIGGTKLSDAVAALAVLGYSSSEISFAMKDIDVESTALEDIIRQSLKKMVK